MPKRILVVDSDSAFSRVLCDNFAFDGFEVLAVRHQGGVIAAVRSFAPDLVVIDDATGGADADWLTALLHQERSTPVLTLSNRGRRPASAPAPADGGGRGRDVVSGASDLLPKPFDLDDLLERVRALLALPASPA